MTDLETLSETYRMQINAMQKTLIEQMKKTFKTFFKENPEVKALAWTQYTPYFNDGDECIFSVHDIYPVTEEQLEELQSGEINVYDLDIEYEYTHGDKKGQPKPSYFEETRKFTRVLSSLDDSIMKAAFGDHVRVIATLEGFDIEEYEHD